MGTYQLEITVKTCVAYPVNKNDVYWTDLNKANKNLGSRKHQEGSLNALRKATERSHLKSLTVLVPCVWGIAVLRQEIYGPHHWRGAI